MLIIDSDEEEYRGERDAQLLEVRPEIAEIERLCCIVARKCEPPYSRKRYLQAVELQLHLQPFVTQSLASDRAKRF
jgi:hypothetical protein